MFRILALSSSLLLPLMANAKTYEWHYQGQPIYCDVDCDWFGTVVREYEPFTGGMVIDSDSLPGGTLSNARIKLVTEYVYGKDIKYKNSFEITSDAGYFEDSWILEQPEWTAGPGSPSWGTGPGSFVQFSGFHEELFGDIVDYGALRLVFDENGQITSWRGAAAWGGSGDPYTSGGPDFWTQFDGFASGARSRGPGTWTLLGDDVSPVPLPATGLLLGLGLAALGSAGAARRRTLRAS